MDQFSPLSTDIHNSAIESLVSSTLSPFATLSQEQGQNAITLPSSNSRIPDLARHAFTTKGIVAQNTIRGSRKNDTLMGTNKADVIKGLSGNDLLIGKGKGDRLLGGDGDDRLESGKGDDQLRGGNGRDNLLGDAGDDFLDGGKGKDILTTGTGKDIVRLQAGHGGDGLETINILKDFEDGQDKLQLKKIKFSDLNIIQGTGKREKDTIIRHGETGEYLMVLQKVTWSDLTIEDFILDSKVEPKTPDPTDAFTSFSIFTTNFSSTDINDESAVASRGGASITVGSQTIYLGYRQVSQVNQDPIIMSFDRDNPERNWTSTKIEVSNADSRGYGLFWSGTDLYAVFSVDGTQGDPKDDFRRGSEDAITPWIQSYGKGGGAKVAVVARINIKTGNLQDAAYISAVLKDGKTNTLRVEDLSMTEQGNLLIHTASRFYPRNVDGSPMIKTGKTEAPFDYMVEITPDLKEVLSTKAVGVR